MPSLVVPNAGLLRFIWTLAGAQYAINVLGVQNPSGSGITQGSTNSLGAAIKTALTTSGFVGVAGTQIALQNIGLRNINVPNQAEFLDNGAPVVGTGSGNMLPPQIALCVTLRTALAGRSFRGRCFLPGFTEEASEANGTCVAGAATTAANFINAVRDACTAAGLPLAVISRPQLDGTPSSAGFATPVTLGVVRDLVWDTQRRRAVPGV